MPPKPSAGVASAPGTKSSPAQQPQQNDDIRRLVESVARLEAKVDALKAQQEQQQPSEFTPRPMEGVGGGGAAGGGERGVGIAPAPPKDGRRGVGFAHAQGSPNADGEEQRPTRRGVRIADDVTPQQDELQVPSGRHNIQFAGSGNTAHFNGGRRASFGASSVAMGAEHKKRAHAAKQKRKEFFDHLVFDGQWNEIPKSPTVRCSWLGCAAMAIHFVSGVETKIEDILRHNRMAMHYVSFPSVTLAELVDAVDEFVTSAPALGGCPVGVEVATFDTSTVDDAGDELGTGDRLPVTSLAAFRKELNAANAVESSIYIFNYDPFIVQDNEIPTVGSGDNADDEDVDEEESAGSPTTGVRRSSHLLQWQRKNPGAFAILLNFNPALHTVTLAIPHYDDATDGSYRLETHMCSIQTLYAACCAKDGYTKRSRGFVRIFKEDAAEEHRHAPVASIFPITLLDGRSANGILSIALDIAIAPHILGIALSHHIACATMLNSVGEAGSPTANQDSALVLRGIPVTDICVTLELPVHIVTGGSTRASLATAFGWYVEYLRRKGLGSQLHVAVVPVSRRGGTEDGMPSVLDEEFFQHVTEVVQRRCVMLVCFDVNVAQNVMIVDAHTDPAHFAIVVGVDEERGVVRLADVSVKKFRKTWHVPLMRLYNAVITFGYMVITQDAAFAERLDVDGARGQHILQMARNKLPPRVATTVAAFEYPRRNYNVTVLASALTQLGFTTSVECIVNNSGFHNSFLLSEHIPLQDLVRILRYYANRRLPGELTVTPHHLDANGGPSASLEELERAVVSACGEPSLAVMLVNFSAVALQRHPTVWNGSSGGPLAIVVAFDAETKTVTLRDSNPEPFFRTWNCPLDLLHTLCTEVDKISLCTRGWISVARRTPNGPPPVELPHEAVDMRRAMVHHPFKPPVSARAAAIALAASLLTGAAFALEDVIYSKSTFSLRNFLLGADVGKTVDLAHTFLAAHGLSASISIAALSPEALLDAAQSGALENPSGVYIVLYKQSLLLVHSDTGVGAAVLATVHSGGDTIAHFVDGNPTKFGTWSHSLRAMVSAEALIGVLHFKKC